MRQMSVRFLLSASYVNFHCHDFPFFAEGKFSSLTLDIGKDYGTFLNHRHSLLFLEWSVFKVFHVV